MNVLNDVENYNKICEFFIIEIDVFYVYFGMKIVNNLLTKNVF